MKKLMIVIAAAVMIAGCASCPDTTLRMTRVVPVNQSSVALCEMVKEIEENNNFKVEDVDREFVNGGDNVKITVTAVEMRRGDIMQRKIMMLQDENRMLRKKIKALEGQQTAQFVQ